MWHKNIPVTMKAIEDRIFRRLVLRKTHYAIKKPRVKA